MVSLANLAWKEIKKLVLYDDGINSKQTYLQNSGTLQHPKWKSKVWWRWEGEGAISFLSLRERHPIIEAKDAPSFKTSAEKRVLPPRSCYELPVCRTGLKLQVTNCYFMSFSHFKESLSKVFRKVLVGYWPFKIQNEEHIFL